MAGTALNSGFLRHLTSVATAASYGPDDIEHVVLFMQENRSFDHYFWDRPGLQSPLTTFSLGSQTWTPFDRECLGDVPHDWDTMHANDAKWRAGHPAGPRTFLYTPRENITLYSALADHYTLCDNMHCSILGPTHPNRLYSVAGTSAGQTTNDPLIVRGTPTILDLLNAGGVDWKVYNLAADLGLTPGPDQLNPFIYFEQHLTDPVTLAKIALPFEAYLVDLAAGTLPTVSIVMSEILFSEHPATPVEYGQLATWSVLRPLLRSSFWPKSLFVLYYDESGGFFDHVFPPAVDDDRPEFRKLGPRVPCLVVSPFAAGGRVAHERFEHASVLRYLRERFSLPGGPLSARDTNATSIGAVLDFDNPRFDVPPLPDVTLSARTLAECAGDAPQWVPNQAGFESPLPSLWDATGLDPKAIPL